MKIRTLLILGILAMAMLAAAVIAYTRKSTEYVAPTPELLYGGLFDRVGDIKEIHVIGPKGEFHVDLEDDQWRMREKGGYPIRTERIRTAVLSLSDLRVIEPKTSRPDNYPLLGLQEPGEGSDSILVEMHDAEGEEIVSIILGYLERGGPMNAPMRRYVRLTGDPRTYFIDGVAEIEVDPVRWIDREILRVLRSWTYDVEIEQVDGDVLRVFRPDPQAMDFELADMPEGTVFIDERDVNLVGNSFIYIGMEDVARTSTLDESKVIPGPEARVRTFDGFVMTAHLFDYEGATWATFEASTTEPVIDVDAANAAMTAGAPGANFRPMSDVIAAAERFNEELDGWRFQMTENKTRLLSFRITDLVQQPGENRSSPIQPDFGPGAPGAP